jgi:hypothetical protein
LNGLYTLKGLNASGPQAGMTRSAYHRLDRRQESFTLSFSTHDQVENDVKDTVYQTAGIAYPVIPDTSGIAFFIRMRFPIKLGMTLWISSKAIPVLRPE